MPTENTKYEAWFNDFFHSQYNGLCNYAFSYLKDEDLAQDVVQTAFVNAWEKREQLMDSGHPERWLLRVVKNKAIDRLRKGKRVVGMEEEMLEQPDNSSTEEDTHTELLRHAHWAISRLPEKTRAVFLLSRQQGLTYKEIAEEMDISPKTVENQMSRALRLLREALQSMPPEMIIIGIFLARILF
jgi:RNA polymerase sigma-70 factor (ECF subfamily)